MNNNTASRICRFVALPVVAGGIIGGAALGFAGAAGATAADNTDVRSSVKATPQVLAPSAPQVVPGSWYHRHKVYLYPQSIAAQFTPPDGM